MARGVIGLVDNAYAAGYLRVGSAAAPNNVSAGDLTAGRFNIGNGAFGTDQVLYIYTVPVNNASVTNALVRADFTPTVGGAYDERGFEVQARYYGSVNNTSVLYAGVFVPSIVGTGKVSYVVGLGGFGVMLRTGAGAAMSVGSARALTFQFVYGAGRAAGETAAIDSLTGVRIDTGYGTLIAGDAVTNAYGVFVQGVGNAKVTNAYVFYAELVTGASALNIGIKLDGATTAALWFNTDTPANGVIAWGTARDTNLYRLSAGVLKTGGKLNIGAPPDYTVTNPSALRAFDVSSVTLDDLAKVVGTIITDLIAMGPFQ